MRLNNLFRPKVDFTKYVVQESDDELLVFNLTTYKIFNLNQICAIVWQNCNGDKTISEITKETQKHFKDVVPEGLIWLTLDLLKKEDLLSLSEESSLKFVNQNRREMLKKIGLSTMVVLPMIASLVAPRSADAQSISAICGSCFKSRIDSCPAECAGLLGECHSEHGCGGGGGGAVLSSSATCTDCLSGVYSTPGDNVSWHYH